MICHKEIKMKIKTIAAIAALIAMPTLANAQTLSLDPVLALIPNEAITGLSGLALGQLPLAGSLLSLASPITEPLLGSIGLVNGIPAMLLSTEGMGGLNMSQNQALLQLQTPLVALIDTITYGVIEPLALSEGFALPL
jgi:hypothetical protein